MTSIRPIARQGSAVVLATFLVVGSTRTAASNPTGKELAEAWRKRLPLRLEELRSAPSAEAYRALLAQKRGEAPWRHGRRDSARGRAPGPVAGLGERFHAGGLASAEPQPLNPLLDPLGLFEDEAGEEPPIASLPRVFFADFDGDGDLDVFAGDKYGYVRYLENVAGPGADPVYEERTGAASPTGSLDLSFDDEDPMETFPFGPSAPALADLDGDDDLDLFVGQGYDDDSPSAGGRVLFFENDGSGNLTRNDAANPFAGFVFGLGFATPTFVDIDEDGDLDAFVGTKSESSATPSSTGGEVYFLRNDGDDENPAFTDQTDVAGQDPFAAETFAPLTAPFFADVDGDGDLDAFVGSAYKIRYFRNDTVLPGPPSFVEQTGYDHPLGNGIAFGPGPALADVDGDGDLDAFVGHGYGKDSYLGFVQYFENTGTPTDPGFLAPGDRLELVDVDGDGDLDALVSHLGYTEPTPERGARFKAAGSPGPLSVWYFENTGTPVEPVWQLRTGLDNPFCTFNTSYVPGPSGTFVPSVAPTVGDLDGDAYLDAFVGLPDGTLELLEDDGTGQLDPAATHPLEGVTFGASADPHLADVNGDGELDLLVGYDVYDDVNETYGSYVALFLNPTGPAGLGTTPDTVLDFSGELVRPAPTVADVDGDGDPDLFVGGYGYDFGYYYAASLFVENEGTAVSPSFDPASAVPAEVLLSGPGSPALGDVDGDGRLDLFIGNLAGVEMFVSEAPQLEVTKEVTGGDMEPGGTVEYTITLTNVGESAQPDDPDDPELTDTLPAGLTLVSATVASGPGSVSTSGSTVRYDGAIGVGESVSIVISASIDEGTLGQTIANQATAFYDTDGDGENETEEPSDDPATGAVDDPTAFVVAGNIDPAEIPTLSQWGSMLFAGLLSLLGLFGLRRFGG